MSHERPSGEQEVRSCCIKSLINEEILLLPSEVAGHLLDVLIEIMAYIGSRHVHGMECPEEWSLVVESLTAVGNEHCRNTERVVDDEHRRGWVPG